MPTRKPPKHTPNRASRPSPPRVPRPLAPQQAPDQSLGPSAASAGRPLDLVGQRSMADWPVHEALVNDGWDEPGGLAVVVVARRHPTYGSIVLGSFVVDLACLGVKDTHQIRARDVITYDRRQRPDLLDHLPPMVAIAPALAAKIVAEGVVYADSLGFKPHRDFTAAQAVLAGLDPTTDPTPVVVGGPDGKPHFIAGPHDNVPAIMAQLRERLGEGGFHFLAPDDRLFDDRQAGDEDAWRLASDSAALIGDDEIEDLLEKLELIAQIDDEDDGDLDDDDDAAGGDFVPLFRRCPDLAADELSHVQINGLRGIPDGQHPLIELYCTDPQCDCRRVILYVMPKPDRPPAAVINYSWADARYLKQWLGDPRASRADIAQLKGPSLEPTVHQGTWAREVLKLVEAQLLSDPAFIAQLERHYATFRAAFPVERVKSVRAAAKKRPWWRRLFGG